METTPKKFKANLSKVPDNSKPEQTHYPLIKWIALHDDGAYATVALWKLMERLYYEN